MPIYRFRGHDHILLRSNSNFEKVTCETCVYFEPPHPDAPDPKGECRFSNPESIGFPRVDRRSWCAYHRDETR